MTNNLASRTDDFFYAHGSVCADHANIEVAHGAKGAAEFINARAVRLYGNEVPAGRMRVALDGFRARLNDRRAEVASA